MLGQASVIQCQADRLCIHAYQAFLRLGSHWNIVSCVEAFEDGDSVHVITSPYCSGGTLPDRLTADTGAPVSESQLANYFKQIVEAIGWCHTRGEATSHQPHFYGYTAKGLDNFHNNGYHW